MKNGINTVRGWLSPYKKTVGSPPFSPPPPPGLQFGAVILKELCHGCLVKILKYATIAILPFYNPREITCKEQNHS